MKTQIVGQNCFYHTQIVSFETNIIYISTAFVKKILGNS